ncbi:MAG: hypothetical protein P4M09_20675 [Devosia sp.]|nr:hypothetical protein [Devosia sp.]
MLWDKREDFDRHHGEWLFDGPAVPLEFSRISETRNNALTLVIDEANGESCVVAYSLSARKEPDDAICDLRCREGTVLRNIGIHFADGSRYTSDAKTVGPQIAEWARDKKIDVVIWTALKSNFAKAQRPFSVENALDHLTTLSVAGKSAAAEYIGRAPDFVNTPLRRAFRALPARMDDSRDFLPRTFQADIDRFFRRIAGPTLRGMVVERDVLTGHTFTVMDEFLDNQEKITTNSVVLETRRILALGIGAIFERQLRIWARVHIEDLSFDRLARMEIVELFGIVAEARKVGEPSSDMFQILREIFLVGNAARHGDGKAIDALREASPTLFPIGKDEKADDIRGAYLLSERLEISDVDFERYMRALVAFWGLADREPFAMTARP